MIRTVRVRTCRLKTLIKTNTRPPSQATNVACRVSGKNDELCISASFLGLIMRNSVLENLTVIRFADMLQSSLQVCDTRVKVTRIK